MKRIAVCIALLMCMAGMASAQWFSGEVPRYTGIAAGGFVTNTYLVGDFAEFARASVGFSAAAEYTLPKILPLNMDWGVAGTIGYAHVFPKTGSTLLRDETFSFAAGMWIRLPFSVIGHWFALQPAVQYGMSLHVADGQNGSSVSGVYADQVLTCIPAFRWIPLEFPALEIELAPLYAFSPEDSATVHQLGFRLGGVWHISKSKPTPPVSPDSVEAHADVTPVETPSVAADNESDYARLREDAKASLQDGNAAFGFGSAGVTDFTPDGDGKNDTVVITPHFDFLTEPAQSWSLAISDPVGNPFYHTGAQGAMPQSIVWDGKGDTGELAYSRNNYTAVLSAEPSEKDKQWLGTDTVSAETTIRTGTILQTVSAGKEWKIAVTSLVFDANAATFASLTKEQLTEVNATLDDVERLIRGIAHAVVTVEGYANNVSNTEREQNEELLPLSQERAEAIAALLAERGIQKERITAVGRGGENPIAAWEDRANWWKNRRIEFVIQTGDAE